jgi:hypothetical protein
MMTQTTERLNITRNWRNLQGFFPPSPLRGEGRGDGSAVQVARSHPHLTLANSIFVKNKNRASVVLPPQGGGGERTDRARSAFGSGRLH